MRSKAMFVCAAAVVFLIFIAPASFGPELSGTESPKLLHFTPRSTLPTAQHDQSGERLAQRRGRTARRYFVKSISRQIGPKFEG